MEPVNSVHPVRRGSGRCRGNTTWRSDRHAGLKLGFWCVFQLLRRPEKSIPHFSDQLQICKRVSQTASRRTRSRATKGVWTDLFLILTTPSTSLMLLLGGVRSVLEMQSPFGGRSAADDGLPQIKPVLSCSQVSLFSCGSMESSTAFASADTHKSNTNLE